MFTRPAFDAYGYSWERFKKLLGGEIPTIIEEHLLLWAYDIALGVIKAYMEKNQRKVENYLEQTIRISEEELDKNDAAEVVSTIYTNIKDYFAEIHELKNNPAPTKTKRKKKKNK